MMSSTLVETVSINCEDFSDSFLTCGTCLSTYDCAERSPKLLPCSHTVCRGCLEHIVSGATSSESPTFRCPICREAITVPRGGVAVLPPSFIVNQLLDLLSRQRRDVVPKCTEHPSQTLLFCETCDDVFCMVCSGGDHSLTSNANSSGSTNTALVVNSSLTASTHTVVPFAIAIKRMSEILLYKASQCLKQLENAATLVDAEMERLDLSAESCADSVNRQIALLTDLMEKRKKELLHATNQVREAKKNALCEQLAIIEAEKAQVEESCRHLHHQCEVRSLSKKISNLNEKLDVSTTLAEPRENAFMVFQFCHNSSLEDIVNSLQTFGKVKVSSTFPALCAVHVDQPVVHLRSQFTVVTVDNQGTPCTEGADPLSVRILDPEMKPVPLDLQDLNDGTYHITWVPIVAGSHMLSVTIFERPVKGSPCYINASPHNNPVMRIGHRRGSGPEEFIQPVAILVDENDNLLVLDAGNERVKVLTRQGALLGHIGPAGLEHNSGTGFALTPNLTLVVVNWRTREVTEVNSQGSVVRHFTSPEFVEPQSIAVMSNSNIVVADNGAGCLFVFSQNGKMMRKIGSRGRKQGQFGQVNSVLVTNKLRHPKLVEHHEVIIVMDTRVQAFCAETGSYLFELCVDFSGKGCTYGGLAVDEEGQFLVSKSEKGRTTILLFDGEKHTFMAEIDSFNDKLRRATGIAVTSDHHVAVADLGNDCLKLFRYS